MLLKAVVERSGDGLAGVDELERLQQAFRAASEGAHKCNSRLKSLEDHAEMEAWSDVMDFKRIVDPEPLLQPGRVLVKEGLLELVKLDGHGRIQNRREVQVMLFSDTFLYAVRKSGKRVKYVVYKQAHRALVQASGGALAPDANTSRWGASLFSSHNLTDGSGTENAEGDPVIKVVMFNATKGEAASLVLRCKSAMEQTRWLDVLDPSDDVVKIWDCPTARVIQNYDAMELDELDLQRGDIVNILTEKDGVCKGYLSNQTLVHGQSSDDLELGYFPKSCVTEIQCVHQQARVYKENYERNQSDQGK